MENKQLLWGVMAVAAVLLLLATIVILNSENNKKQVELENLEQVNSGLKTEISAIQSQNADLEETVDLLVDRLDKVEAEQIASEELKELALLEAETAQTELERVRAELLAVEASAPTKTGRIGKVIDNLFLNDAVNFIADERDLDQLLFTNILHDGVLYDVREEFFNVPGTLVIGTSLSEKKEFGDEPRLLLTARKALVYRYVFDDPVDTALINNEYPLRIEFLGKELTLVKVTASEATVRSGTEVFLFEGEEIVFEGKTVKLSLVGDNSVYVTVDGVSKVVREYKSELINGLDVRVEDVLSKQSAGAATLVLGTDTIYTQRHNDAFFEDKNFLFNIVLDGSDLKELNVVYDVRRTDLSGDRAALKLGEEISFPNNYVNIKFDNLLNTNYVDFRLSFEVFDETVVGVGDVLKNCVLLEGETDRSIEIGSVEKVKDLYVCSDSTVYYKDRKGDWQEDVLSAVKLVNDRTTFTLAMGGGNKLRFVDPLGECIELDTRFVAQKLGSTEGKADANEVVYSGYSVGAREYDVLTLYGAVIRSPEDNGDNDEFELSIPSDRVEAEILVY